MAEGAQTIIIKRVKKGGHVAAHGGTWKIAYADFVTAMMAFFLLLWLLNSVTQDQLEGISNYFAPISISATTSGDGDILEGKALQDIEATSRPTATMDLPPPKAGEGPAELSGEKPPEDLSDQEAEELLKKKEQEQFEEAEKDLQEAIDEVPSLKAISKSLLIDDTPEGMRIQIVDQEGLALFARGSAELYLHTKKILELVAKVIQTLPQKVSISGHTDATKYGGAKGYSNWELSADRANAARRYLVHRGVDDGRINRVVGKASTELLQLDNPSHASNRRLSIVLMRGTGLKDEALPGLSKAKQTVDRPDGEEEPDNGLISGPPGISIPLGPAKPKPESAPVPAPVRQLPGLGEARRGIGAAEPESTPKPRGGVLIPLGPAKPEAVPVPAPKPESAPVPAPEPEVRQLPGLGEARRGIGGAKPEPASKPGGGVSIPLGPARPAPKPEPVPKPGGGVSVPLVPAPRAGPVPMEGEVVIPLRTPKGEVVIPLGPKKQ